MVEITTQVGTNRAQHPLAAWLPSFLWQGRHKSSSGISSSSSSSSSSPALVSLYCTAPSLLSSAVSLYTPPLPPLLSPPPTLPPLSVLPTRDSCTPPASRAATWPPATACPVATCPAATCPAATCPAARWTPASMPASAAPLLPAGAGRAPGARTGRPLRALWRTDARNNASEPFSSVGWGTEGSSGEDSGESSWELPVEGDG